MLQVRKLVVSQKVSAWSVGFALDNDVNQNSECISLVFVEHSFVPVYLHFRG